MPSYEDRGVSPHKPDVRRAVASLKGNAFPGAFCWIVDDILGGDATKCVASHADGAGTKAVLAYLHYRETGDYTIFRGIAQDSLAMNINDLIAIGATGPYVVSNTIGRNSKKIDGYIIEQIIAGYQEQIALLSSNGIICIMAGGETADLGDLVRTLVIDTTLTVRMDRKDVIDISKITPGLAIVGVASFGRANYETRDNSGVGTNGFSALRHDILSNWYQEKFPESFAPEIASVAYQGKYRLTDQFPFGNGTVGDAILSPTRIYAPIVKALIDSGIPIRGIVNNSGGGQTKCLNFGRGIHYVKNNLFAPPPVFNFIRSATAHSVAELARTYNIGTMLEFYVLPQFVSRTIEVVESFGVAAQQIGYTESSLGPQKLSLRTWGEDVTWTEEELD